MALFDHLIHPGVLPRAVDVMCPVHGTCLKHHRAVVQKRPNGGDEAFRQAGHFLDRVLGEIADEGVYGCAVGEALVEVMLEELEFLGGAAGDGPADVGGGEGEELFGAETAGVAGRAEEDYVVFAWGLGRHGWVFIGGEGVDGEGWMGERGLSRVVGGGVAREWRN